MQKFRLARRGCSFFPQPAGSTRCQAGPMTGRYAPFPGTIFMPTGSRALRFLPPRRRESSEFSHLPKLSTLSTQIL
jgi:hypothetical protein